ncbi:ATP-binding cassette domain-containing protein [Microbacterium oxydans]|uniref:ATP-binding cassette domain-containing protein n=1 Tax=Microbacterium oxydans TaxID=82380 RepID=UPI001E344443|nr:ATP-binding cassette domain-containing protein [Microbacterium oxydans]
MRIVVADVSVTFSGREVLNVASATFIDGGICGIVGPSGSGKSSLLSVIAGLREPDTGTVVFHHGNEARQTSRDDVAWVPQGAYLLPERSVVDNVAIGALAEGANLLTAMARAEVALDQVGLRDRGTATASVLSGGETQRVALARAICMSRPIIIADEPTASLDRDAAQNVAEVLGRLQAERLVIVATHDPLLMAQCDTILDLGSR